MNIIFRNGYCYYFAHILKLAFNRGVVCIAAPLGHFVWVDVNEIPYDIEGDFRGREYIYTIPESYMSEDMINDFKHVEGLESHTTAEDVAKLIKRYENDINSVRNIELV